MAARRESFAIQLLPILLWVGAFLWVAYLDPLPYQHRIASLSADWYFNPFTRFPQWSLPIASVLFLFLLLFIARLRDREALLLVGIERPRQTLNLLLWLAALPPLLYSPSLVLSALCVVEAVRWFYSINDVSDRLFRVSHAGALLGIAALLRPPMLIFLLLFATQRWLVRQQWARSLLALLLGFIMPLLILSPLIFYYRWLPGLAEQFLFFITPATLPGYFEQWPVPYLFTLIAIFVYCLITLVLYRHRAAQDKERIREMLHVHASMLWPLLLGCLFPNLMFDYSLMAILSLGTLLAYGQGEHHYKWVVWVMGSIMMMDLLILYLYKVV